MRSHYSFSTFFIISLAVQFPRTAQFPDSVNDHKNRRILHQPLFPVNSAPLPPTPPPPPVPDFPDQDQPFSHELPTGPPLDQALQPPPLPATSTPAAHPVATKPSKPTKEVAVAILSAILTLGMLSGVAFYLYKNCEKHCSDESQKLVGENTQRINEESRMPPPPSTFLCVETAEPSRTSLTNENNMRSGSPYRKLKSDRYRPSPEIQPLPPLKKLPPPPPAINSPPPMSSSDDESHENCFYTNKESPNSRQVVNSVPHSKRTSPKSRFSSSSPIKKSLPPSPSPSPPPPATSFGPLQPSKTLPYTPKRTKFSPSPPSDPERSRRSVRNNEHQISKIPIPSPPPPPPPPPPVAPPPPPPPPPPPQSIPTRNGAVKTYKFSQVPKQRTRPKSKSPSPEAIPASEKTRNLEEVNKVTSSSEKYDGEDKDGPRSTMKPLHWDKVRAPSDRATVWDQLKSSSFQLNEDAMESLFGRNTVKSVPRPEPTRKKVLPCFELEDRVLDPKKSQNIAILLRALNVTREEVSEALLDGNPEGLGPELFETLVKMAPTKEEEIKLKNYNDESSKLGPAERFLKAILEIPFAFKRVEAMLYTTNFDAEVKYLRKSFQTLEEASEELKNSRLFLKLLEAVLRTGNRMNDGTNRGDAKAFKLDTLLKLVDIKGTDGKTTLLHFVVQEIIRSEGAVSNSTSETQTDKSSFRFNEDDFKKQGLQVVAGLSKELGNVKKAAGMDSDVLSSYVSKLETGLQKVRQVLQYENQSMQGKFFDSMRAFLKEAVDEISRVKAEERKALSMVKEVTLYFHGDAANQEAHPLRIFMIIRDFLAVLDNVCKDVRTMQDRTTLGSGRSFRISATAPLPVLNRYNMPNDRSSDDDSM